MPSPAEVARLRTRALAILERRGPLSASAIYDELDISQSTFSRAVANDPAMLRIGRGRNVRYAARRRLPDGAASVPVWRVDAQGQVHDFASLDLLSPEGLVLGHPHPFQVVPDLPWCLEDLRPQGFLGRLVARQFSDPASPADIRLWGVDHVLAWLIRFGWNGPGDLIVGEPALQMWLRNTVSAIDAVPQNDRLPTYGRWCQDVLRQGRHGSSAAGEQPKFLATRVHDGHPTPVIVKFSPPHNSPAGRRTADLLIAEHHAATTLRQGGHSAAPTQVLISDDRTMLEVERFDRVDGAGRRGTVSLHALGGHHTGTAANWLTATQALIDHGIVPMACLAPLQVRSHFGTLIQNTDMHAGNLTFYVNHPRVTGLAPSYDMLPMHFAPRAQEVVKVDILTPSPRAVAGWAEAWELAVAFWRCVEADQRCSTDFREVAAASRAELLSQASIIARLPS